jgi:uncharacterized cofD-like protein
VSLWRWLVPGMNVKRFVLLIALGLTILLLGFVAWARVGPQRNFFINTTARLIELSEDTGLGRWGWAALIAGSGFLLLGVGVVGLNRSLLRGLDSSPAETLERIYNRRALGRGPRIVAIGGGTGLSNLLSGLKRFSSNITAIVAVTDDGGSSGRLRTSLGMPAPGDLTDCYAALSDSPVLAKLLLHRFARGDGLEGHTFGNVFIATLAEERGSFRDATLSVNEILNVRGRVLPASLEPAVLVAELEDGALVRGESSLHVETRGRRVTKMRTEPANLTAAPEALEAIRESEVIVVGPGSLYTSVTPPLLVAELAASIRGSRALLVYICNVMTEPGESDGLSASEHVAAITAHLGRVPDVVLVNDAPVSDALRERYANVGSSVVERDLEAIRSSGAQPLSLPLLKSGEAQHDPRRLAAALMRLMVARRLRRPLTLYTGGRRITR